MVQIIGYKFIVKKGYETTWRDQFSSRQFDRQIRQQANLVEIEIILI